MRTLIVLLTLLLSFSALADVVVFKNANVITMTSPKVSEKTNVVVKDGRIEAVGKKVKIPEGAKVIDATGQYLIPGLSEMHGHIPPMTAPKGVIDDVLLLYLANGITTVRGMLGHPGQLEVKEKLASGAMLGPTLYLAGPSFNGQSVNSPQEAIDKVKAQKQEGWDLLKVHPGLTREEFDAMAKTANEVGIRFAGHVPEEVGLLHALEMGQETFDHIDGYVEYLQGDKGPVDPKKLAEVVKLTKAKNAWIVPTSALWEVLYNAIPLETLQAYPELKYVPASAVETWTKLYNDRLSNVPREAAANVMANRRTILRALHEGGVKILMGTDAPQQFSIPGFSLHRELLRMRDAGMSPYEILKSGTVNVGQYFAKKDAFGTIEPGKRADLVLLAANPLTDIANVSKINGVMVRGRWIDAGTFAYKLEKIETMYKR